MADLNEEAIATHLRRAWLRFNANLSALTAYVQKMPQVADQLDKNFAREAAEKIARLFDEHPDDVECELRPYILDLETQEVLPNYREDPENQEMFEAIDSGDFVVQGLRWAKEHPEKLDDLKEVLEIVLEPAANGILLRRGALIMLMSFFETLAKDLTIGYHLKDQLKNMLVSQPISFETAYEFAQKALRNKDKFDILLSNLASWGADYHLVPAFKAALDETHQRRNLFVHREGAIDSLYLGKLPKSAPYNTWNYQSGQVFLISGAYLKNAVQVVNLVGCVLYQLAVRTWMPDQKFHQGANEHLVKFIYRQLLDENYRAIETLFEIRTHLKLERKYKHLLMVNQAIALREQGRHREMHQIVNVLDRKKGKSEEIRMAILVLQRKYRDALARLDQVLDARVNQDKPIDTLSQKWVLFKPLLSDPRYAGQFRAIFRKPRNKKPGR